MKYFLEKFGGIIVGFIIIVVAFSLPQLPDDYAWVGILVMIFL